jgi:hypothetical protein
VLYEWQSEKGWLEKIENESIETIFAIAYRQSNVEENGPKIDGAQTLHSKTAIGGTILFKTHHQQT